MNRELGWLVTAGVALATCISGCRHKPAYSDIDTSAPKNQTRAEAKLEETPSNVSASQTQATASPAFKRPSFLGPDGGTIQDLPDYPGGRRENVVIGPNQGTNMITLALTTPDRMDKIASFYEQVINNNHWSVVNKVVDPEFSEWNLKKGEDNIAKITVKKDAQTGRTTIVVYRAEKLQETPR